MTDNTGICRQNALWLELEKGAISRTELFTRRFRDVFSRCEGDASGLDPLKINDEYKA